MNILLLGASGYLGSNIAYCLSNEKYHIVCAVRGTSDISRLKQMKAELISSEPDMLELTLKSRPFDWIINGACTYKKNATFYGDMLESNVMFPLSVLNLAVKYGVKNYMTMGTGLPDQFTPYSFTKHRFSDFGKYLSRTEGINFADLQLEMFYGGIFEPENRFLNSCKHNLRENRDISLTEGYQKRDIIRVEDVVSIILELIRQDYVQGYRLLPVGSGENHSIRKIMSFMKCNIQSSGKLMYGNMPGRIEEPDTLADIGWYKEIAYRLKFTYWEGLKAYTTE